MTKPQCKLRGPLGDDPGDWVYVDEENCDVVFIWTGGFWESFRLQLDEWGATVATIPGCLSNETAEAADALIAMLAAFKAKVKEER